MRPITPIHWFIFVLVSGSACDPGVRTSDLTHERDATSGRYCGDALCDAARGETCISCPADCRCDAGPQEGSTSHSDLLVGGDAGGPAVDHAAAFDHGNPPTPADAKAATDQPVKNWKTYYVRTDGNNSNTGLTNTSAGAWRTIDWAADHVAAGDVVRVQAGTYSERVSPAVSGTSPTNTVTFVADGAVTFCGMDVSSKSYLRVIGFTIDTDAGCPKSNRAVNVGGTNTGLEFWNNTMRDANGAGISSGSYGDLHHNFIVIGNRFTALGPGAGAVSLRGNNSVIAYNEVSGVDCDAFIVDGNYNRWLNNYIHNVLDVTDAHSDIFQSNASSLGLSYNLFEGNFEVGNGTLPNEHGSLFQNQSTKSCSTGTCGPVTENLFRRNVWHDSSGGAVSADQAVVGPITNTREVSDTIVSPMRTEPGAEYGTVFNGAGITAWFYNNVNYKAWGDSVTTGVEVVYAAPAPLMGIDYNLAYTPDATPTFKTPWTTQAHPQTNVNPAFVDVANDNFTLGASSGARGTGGPLTTTSGSGTGTTFNVATGGGGFFRGPNPNVAQGGGNLTAGDVITIGSTTRAIASVSGDAITVTQSFSWTNGQPVYLGPSTTPDIGAYPYKAGGYGLTATYTLAGNTATVTPNDASLVRFVICYEDGIPTTVDNSSPYTCPVTGGKLVVRAYPLYASKTLFVTP